MFIRYSKKQEAWIVSEAKSHNHTTTEDPDEHPVHRRLQPVEKQQLAVLATGDCRLSIPQISRMLKASNPHSISIPMDIRNAVKAAKCDKLRGLTNIEATMERLQKISWQYSTSSRRMKTDVSRI